MENTVNHTPFITIGMPVLNRASSISRILAAIENIDYPRTKVKLVFVDAFSVDGTYETLLNWMEKSKRYFYDIVLIRKETNIPQARNLCISNAFGDFILFWDSDVLPPQNLLKQMVDIMFNDKRIGIIGADYYYIFKNSFTKIIGQPLIDKDATYAFMGFTLIRMQVFNRISPFNESFAIGEDSELVMRLIKETEFKTIWAPRPVLHLKEPISFRKAFKWALCSGFHERGTEMAINYSSLPLFSKARLLYYGIMPVILALALFSSYITQDILGVLVVIIYILFGIFIAIRNSNVRKGTSIFIIYLPVNIAISYGALVHSIKRFFVVK